MGDLLIAGLHPRAAFVLPVASSVKNAGAVLNLPAIFICGFLIWFDSARPTELTSVIRDWLPLAFMLLAYREMGWFALFYRTFALESHWVV